MIHILYGEEEFLRAQRRQALLEELLQGLPRDFALQVMRGRSFTPHRLMEFYELAFGSPYKVVLFLEAETLSKTDLRAIETYCQNPSPTNHLILDFHQESAPTLPKREGIRYEKFDRLRGKELLAWVEKSAQARSLSLPPESVSFLVEAVGQDLRLLDQTLDTLSLAGIDLTPGSLAEALGLHPQYNLYRLMDALAEKNRPLIWRIFAHIAEDTRTFPVATVLWQLNQFYQRLALLKVAFGQTKPTSEAIQSRLGLRYSFQARPYSIALAKYTFSEVQQALQTLYDIDAYQKGLWGGRVTEKGLLYELVTRLLHPTLPAL
jgi:DNA polymerase III delta subunit